jgi:hypothetical protein
MNVDYICGLGPQFHASRRETFNHHCRVSQHELLKAKPSRKDVALPIGKAFATILPMRRAGIGVHPFPSWNSGRTESGPHSLATVLSRLRLTSKGWEFCLVLTPPHPEAVRDAAC